MPEEVNAISFRCLYCDTDQHASSLEHAIPQFLGGAHAPLHYKIRNVCVTCNSRLGLHVDGSYARSWTVTNGLAVAARRLFTGPGKLPLPLACMGILPNIPGLDVPPKMVAEFWAGPSGENIVWIRSEADHLAWYVGGHPIARKKDPSTVYYLPTAADPVGFNMGLEAFQAEFKKVNARRIFGAAIADAPQGFTLPGFDAPSDMERQNLTAIRAAMAGKVHGRMVIHTRFDDRFICKMVLAIGYSLFGDPFLLTEQARQARLGLWPKEGHPTQLRTSSTFMQPEGELSKLTGYPSAVLVTILRVDQYYSMTVNIDQRLPFIADLAPASLTSPHINPDAGYALLLFPQLRESLELEWADVLAHRLGNNVHPALCRIDNIVRQAEEFNASLPPLTTEPPTPDRAVQ